MASLMASFMAGGLAFATGNAHAATVFLVCDGNFKTITGVSDPHSRSKGAHASAGTSYYDDSSDMTQETFTIAAALNKNIPIEDEFNGTFYLSIDGSEGIFSRIKL